MNDPCFDCETFAIKSLNDFGDLEVNLLKHMEEEFKNQLGDYVSLEIQQTLICKFAFVL